MKKMKLTVNTISFEIPPGGELPHSASTPIPVSPKYGYNILCDLIRSDTACASIKK